MNHIKPINDNAKAKMMVSQARLYNAKYKDCHF